MLIAHLLASNELLLSYAGCATSVQPLVLQDLQTFGLMMLSERSGACDWFLEVLYSEVLCSERIPVYYHPISDCYTLVKPSRMAKPDIL